MKYVVIINGKPRSGKDTFIDYCKVYLDHSEYANFRSVSSIDPVKDVLRKLGWNGEKRDDVRNILSQLKFFWITNNDGPTAYLIDNVLECDKGGGRNDDYVIFTQIREPAEIDKFKNAMLALAPLRIKVMTLLISRHDTDKNYNNTSDRYVYDYEYDTSIENNGTLDELNVMAKAFIDKLLEEDKKDGK